MSSANAARNNKGSRPGKKTPKKSAGARVSKKGKDARAPFLEGGMRDDLIGILLAVIGVVLLVAVVMPGSAVLSTAISTGLKHAFGLGAFIVPFGFILWGVTYFLKTEEIKAWRIIIGIAIILVAVMSILSLFCPLANPQEPITFFEDPALVSGGGYLGGAVAWALTSLLGQVIGCIILIALIIVGFVLIGISVSLPFIFVKNFILGARDTRENEFDDLAYAGDDGAYDSYAADDPGYYDPDETLVLEPAKKKRGKRKNTKRLGEPEPVMEPEQIYDGAPEYIDSQATMGDTVYLSDDNEVTKTVKLSKSSKKGATAKKPARKTTENLGADNKPTALDGFVLPPTGILKMAGSRKGAATGELKQTAALLQQTLEEFGLNAKVVGWLAGPTVTMYKVDLPSGVRMAKLTSLADDIALSLAAEAVRIAQIPGTSLVGVEIPNKTRSTVLFGDILNACKPGPLQVAVGEDVDGDRICADLAKMPHLLIAGTTGSGKSVCLNGMIMTMLMRCTPSEVRMIMIDPKRVEFSVYNGIPHLFVPPVTEPKEAASALRWAVAEMERRLKVFEGVGARNIGVYNKLIQDGKLTDDNGDHPDEMPYIVVVIDELSDLMMVAGKEVEDSIVRIAQLARAAGIHLIIATQRPTSNVVTGMIKANITNRIALSVATSMESRVIIDQTGAEKLVGHGDMLYVKPEWGKPKRIQGCFVDDAEIASVVEHLKEQGKPEYNLDILSQAVGSGSASSGGGMSGGGGAEDDPLIWEAADAVVSAGLGSTSMLQRRLKVGYARAGRIMDMLEAKGIVGPQEGSRARDVLIDSVEDLEALRAFEDQDAEEM